MFKKLKLKKTIFFVSLPLLLIIFIIGSIAYFGFYQKNNPSKKKDSKFILDYDNLDYAWRMIDNEEKNFNKEINKILILANLKVDSHRLEEEAKMLSYLSTLLTKVEIDPNKTEMTYAYEISNVLNKVNLTNLNLNDVQVLNYNGSLLLSLADELSKIKPTNNYLKIHKAEIIIIGGIGYLLKELSTIQDNEKAMALIRIINDLIDYQKQISELLLK